MTTSCLTRRLILNFAGADSDRLAGELLGCGISLRKTIRFGRRALVPLLLVALLSIGQAPATAASTGSIRVIVTAPHGISAGDVSVDVYAATDPDGRINLGSGGGYDPDANEYYWTMKGLKPGSYKVKVKGEKSGALDAWYGGETFATAATVKVSSGQVVDGLQFSLVRGATLAGTVTAPAGVGTEGAPVEVYSAGSSRTPVARDFIEGGKFKVYGLSAGTYKLKFSGDPDYGSHDTWYGGASSFATAKTIILKAAQDVTGLKTAVPEMASIVGKVTAPKGKNRKKIRVHLFHATGMDQYGSYEAAVDAAADGTFRFRHVTAGKYKVKFYGTPAELVSQWYGGTSHGNAKTISVGKSGVVSGINASLIRASTASGKIIAPKGVKLEGTMVTVDTRPKGHEGVIMQHFTATTYKLKTLQAGRYKISFMATDSKGRLYAGSKSFTVGKSADKTGQNVTLQRYYAPVSAPYSVKITGTAKVGSKLSLTKTDWYPKPVKLSYQWYRSGKPIKDAVKSAYTLTKPDVGKTVKLKVTGSKSGWASVYKTSNFVKVKR
ncbi:MAG: hypothetical protein ACQEXN_05130 [Actinomycetota bacterium]